MKHTCTVVFMPGDTTSMAFGLKGNDSRNRVVVAPACTQSSITSPSLSLAHYSLHL